MEPNPIDMSCNLFGILLKFAQSHTCKSNTRLCELLNVSKEELEDLKNNVIQPSDELIELFSSEFELKSNKVKYFCFHDAEPSKMSLRFRKWSCIKIAKCLSLVTFKPMFSDV